MWTTQRHREILQNPNSMLGTEWATSVLFGCSVNYCNNGFTYLLKTPFVFIRTLTVCKGRLWLWAWLCSLVFKHPFSVNSKTCRYIGFMVSAIKIVHRYVCEFQWFHVSMSSCDEVVTCPWCPLPFPYESRETTEEPATLRSETRGLKMDGCPQFCHLFRLEDQQEESLLDVWPDCRSNSRPQSWITQ